jgi:aryl-alcohol dehydrogenase-like predicted oxidoreductase
MKYHLLGSTGLKVSELCLGTMTFGGNGGIWAAIGAVLQDEANQLVKTSVDAGINFIDTANIYSLGLSEEITGKAIRSLGLHRDELVLATKVRGKMGEGPNQIGLSRKHIMEQVEASLKRLQTDYIDLYQIHVYDPVTPLEETLRALNDLVTSGKVRYIGCSNMAAWQLMKALSTSERMHWSSFVSLQAYYTIAGRDLEREVVPLLIDQRVGLLVWSPLAGGLLSGKFDRHTNADAESRRANFDFPPVDKEKAYDIIDVMRPIAQAHGASVAQIALAWLLHQPVVTSVIIGAKRPDQLSDNLKAIDLQLSSGEMDQLNEVSKLRPEYPGWMLDRFGHDR